MFEPGTEMLPDQDPLALLQALLAENEAPARARIERRTGEGDPIASSSQKGLWFLHQREPGSAAYNVPLVFEVEGKLDAAILGQALDEIIRRHEPLRTVFRLQDGELRQRVLPAAPFTLSRLDFQGSPDSLKTWIRELSAKPFDLENGPVIRGGLAQVAAEKQVLLLVMHHALVDAWSGELIFGELFDVYRSLESGRPLPPNPVLQYGDYAQWQARQTYEKSLEFWKAKLAEVRPVELPADRPKPAQRTHAGGKVRFEIPKEKVEALRERGRQSGTTLFVSLASVFQVCLHRLSGQTDVVVGSGGAARALPELTDVVGLFLNNLVLRTDFSGEPSFAAVLDRVRDGFLESLEHQEVPFEQILAAVNTKRGSEPNPLFNVVFTLNERAAEVVPVSSAKIRLLDPNLVEVGCAKHDLSVHCWNVEGALEGVFEYSADRFDRATVEAMAGAFGSILDQALACDTVPVSQFEILGGEARSTVLEAWNRTERLWSGKSVVDQFRAVARLLPESPAVVCCHRTLNYGQLDDSSDRIAAVLRRSGLRAEDPVAVCTGRTADLVTAFVGTLKAGGAYLPLDPNQPVERLRSMVKESAPHTVLCDAANQALVKELGVPHRLISELETCEREILEGPKADQLAYVLFTSGSTGTPKGVMVEHRSLGHLAEWARDQYALGPGDRAGFFTNVAFDPTLEELGAYLASGVAIHMAPDHLRLSPDDMARWMEERGLTVCQLPAPILDTVVDRTWPKGSGLRFLLTGGERLRKRPRPDAPFKVVNRYGPTECTVYCTQELLGEPTAVATIGKPIGNTQIYLLDRNLQPVFRGSVGEIFVGGVGVARGYWNDAEKTARAFLPSPFRAGERLYRTGDLGRFRADGTIEFLGRADGQVKIRGMRIEIGEIEAALKSCPGVKDSMVLPVKSESGEYRLVGYGIGAATEETVRAFLRARLPENMVPSRYVTLEAFPLTANGKVDAKRLPVPTETAAPKAAPTAGLTGLAGTIAQAWSEVLGVAVTDANKNFFDLGGHSLLLAKVQAKLNASLGRSVALTELIKHPTISALAGSLGEGPGPNRAQSAALDEAKKRAELRARRLGLSRN